jgi:glutaminyl-peptide cyclotransferase
MKELNIKIRRVHEANIHLDTPERGVRAHEVVNEKGKGRLEVFDGNQPVEYLNELEFVDGKIYANVQRQDRIAIIQPDSGQVTGWIDLAGLKSLMPPLPAKPLPAVMNGIAYDATGRRLFVTGKLWPKVFQIRLKPQ